MKTLELNFRSHKRQNNYAKFLACDKDCVTLSSFTQSGDLRSGSTWKEFEGKKEFVDAINNYLNSPKAAIHLLKIDNAMTKPSKIVVRWWLERLTEEAG